MYGAIRDSLFDLGMGVQLPEIPKYILNGETGPVEDVGHKVHWGSYLKAHHLCRLYDMYAKPNIVSDISSFMNKDWNRILDKFKGVEDIDKALATTSLKVLKTGDFEATDPLTYSTINLRGGEIIILDFSIFEEWVNMMPRVEQFLAAQLGIIHSARVRTKLKNKQHQT